MLQLMAHMTVLQSQNVIVSSSFKHQDAFVMVLPDSGPAMQRACTTQDSMLNSRQHAQLRTACSAQDSVTQRLLMQVDLHYNGFCNSVLWQLFHYIPLNLESKLSDTRTLNFQWKAHQEANRKFAEVVCQSVLCMGLLAVV